MQNGKPSLSSIDAAAAFVAYADGITERISSLVAAIEGENETLRAKADALREHIAGSTQKFAAEVQAFLERVHATNKLLDAEHARLTQ